MDKRILGIVALLALAIAVVWTLRARTPASALAEPAHAESAAQPPDSARLTASEAPKPARASVESPAVVEAPPAKDAAASSTFALIKLLVVNKASRAPMADIDVEGTYDDGKRGHVVTQTASSHGRPFESLHTDEEGRAEIEMPPDVDSHVNASGSKQDAGYDQAVIPPLKAGEVKEITLEIPTGNDMPFWIKVVDDPSQAPIVGASVISTKDGGDSEPKTDARGLLLLPCRTWDRHVFHVDAQGYPQTWLSAEAGHPDASTAFVVTIAKCATVHLHVVDGVGGALADAKVDLTTPGYNLGQRGGARSMDLIMLDDPHWTGITDGAGNMTIACVPTGIPISGGIKGPKPWSAPDKLVFEPGETRNVEWKITNGCNVHGLLLDQTSAPVTKRAMWMRKTERRVPTYFQPYGREEPLQAVTDEEGRFRFADVGAGIWWIGPSAPKAMEKIASDDVAALAQVVEIAEGQSDLDVTVRVDRGLFIRGHIFDSKGAPTKDGYVDGIEQSSKLRIDVNLEDGNNAFTLGPLMKGHYLLTASGYWGDADSDPVEADAGAEDVVLRLKVGASISGSVFGTTGDVTHAKIVMTMRDSTTFGMYGVACDNKGAFHIGGLPGGTYDIAASASDGSTGLLERVVVETGQSKSGLSIRLAPGGHVRVRHEGPDRYVGIAVLAHGILVDNDGIERGATHELSAPAGSVTVRATYYETEKRSVARTVEVKPGETVDVVFEKDAH